MPVRIEGGCRVAGLTEGEPERAGGLRAWRCFGRDGGTLAISLRVLELEPGRSPGLRNAEADEVLYVLEGRGRAWIDGRGFELEPDTGFYLAPGRTLTLEADQRLVLASSRCPDPGGGLETVEPVLEPPAGTDRGPTPFVRLRDEPPQTTGDRWYKTLVGRAQGSLAVTQFVGAIPPGRAPDHFHHYEEVLCILQGSGRMWAGRTQAPIGPGSCIFLPRGQWHCVENQGPGELVLLGVLFPAGSPAVRYEAD